MNRRSLTLLGGFLLILATGLGVIVATAPEFVVDQAIQGLLFAVAGICFVLGGEGIAPGGLKWNQFVGLADVVLGTYFAVYNPLMTAQRGASTFEWVLVAAFFVGGLSLIFIGIDTFRGGKHVDLSIYETEPEPE